jgi:hypothetical protein
MSAFGNARVPSTLQNFNAPPGSRWDPLCTVIPCERRTPDPSTFKAIITDYLASKDFTELRDHTKRDYLQQIAKIEGAIGDLPLAALDFRHS